MKQQITGSNIFSQRSDEGHGSLSQFKFPTNDDCFTQINRFNRKTTEYEETNSFS